MSGAAIGGRSERAGTARLIGREAVGSVGLAWLGSRLIVLAAGVLAAVARGQVPSAWTFAVWDGAWYRDIALIGYELDRPDRAQTPYPFFPLLPGILLAADALGLRVFLTSLLLNNALFLAALLGLWLLVRGWRDAPTATMAVWAAALLPGSQAFSMVYPEALFFAASVWAFWLAERADAARIDTTGFGALAVGALGAVTSLVRPNGILVPISLAAGVLASGRTSGPRLGVYWRLAAYLLPACLAVGTWMLYLWISKGDPFIWIRAKTAWTEVTLLSVFRGDDVRWAQIAADVAPMPFVFASLWWSWERLPASWRAFAAFWVALPLLTGVIGWPRYAASCFPVAASLGAVLTTLPQRWRRSALALSALGLACYSYLVLELRICP